MWTSLCDVPERAEAQPPCEVVPLCAQPPLCEEEVGRRDVVVLVQVQRLDYVLLRRKKQVQISGNCSQWYIINIVKWALGCVNPASWHITTRGHERMTSAEGGDRVAIF